MKYFKLTLLIMSGILLAGVRADSIVIEAFQTKPIRPLKHANKEDIREAVFRYQFTHNASAQQQAAKVYVLSIEGDKDPSDSFMTRFKGHNPPVKKNSQARGEFEVIDKDTGLRGLRFNISAIKQISDDEVKVDGGYYEGGLSSSGNVYTVKRKGKKWTVTEDKMLWISNATKLPGFLRIMTVL